MINIIFAIIILSAGVLAGVLSWMFSDFFISRQQRYKYSRAQLLTKKIKWAAFWVIFSMGIIAFVGKKIKKKIDPKYDNYGVIK